MSHKILSRSDQSDTSHQEKPQAAIWVSSGSTWSDFVRLGSIRLDLISYNLLLVVTMVSSLSSIVRLIVLVGAVGAFTPTPFGGARCATRSIATVDTVMSNSIGNNDGSDSVVSDAAAVGGATTTTAVAATNDIEPTTEDTASQLLEAVIKHATTKGPGLRDDSIEEMAKSLISAQIEFDPTECLTNDAMFGVAYQYGAEPPFWLTCSQWFVPDDKKLNIAGQKYFGVDGPTDRESLGFLSYTEFFGDGTSDRS